MKFIPTFFATCVLVAGIAIYSVSLWHFTTQPSYREYDKGYELTLSEIQRSNIKMEPNVNYWSVYKIRNYRYGSGIKLKSKQDTIYAYILATRNHNEGGKPNLPKNGVIITTVK